MQQKKKAQKRMRCKNKENKDKNMYIACKQTVRKNHSDEGLSQSESSSLDIEFDK